MTAARPRLVALEGNTVSQEPWPLDPGFERALVTAACQRPRVYGRVVHQMPAELFNTAEARLAVSAVHEIAKDRGTGPDSLLLVIQRIRRRMQAGQVTLEELEAVNAYFDAATDAGIPEDDALVDEVVPVVKLRLEHAALQGALRAKAKGDSEALTEAGHALAAVQGFGLNDTSLGTRIGSASFDQVVALQSMQRLPLGVYELDDRLGGGIANGFSMMFIGGTGDGKSMALSHALSFNSLMGGVHCYATLELPPAIILARVKAYLTGIPITDILQAGAQMEEARRRIEELERGGRLGTIMLKYFTPGVTTPQEIFSWVSQVEYETGMPVRTLAIDYQDLLDWPGNAAQHEKDNLISRSIQVWSNKRGAKSPFWTLTASQGSRDAGQKGSKIKAADVAGGMGKPRNADAIITLNARDEGKQMEFYVDKDRLGPSKYTVGPLPVDFALGRIGPFRDPEDYGDVWTRT